MVLLYKLIWTEGQQKVHLLKMPDHQQQHHYIKVRVLLRISRHWKRVWEGLNCIKLYQPRSTHTGNGDDKGLIKEKVN